MDFRQKLSNAWAVSGSRLCVGLDPLLDRIPARFRCESRPILAFNKWIIDQVGDLVCALKPQHAHHAALACEADLAETIAYIHARHPAVLVILDAKRGDIGATADLYAKEAFDRYDADAVTVNPFMGDDSVLPFLTRPDRGAVVLCRTSNPDAARIQGLATKGNKPLFAEIAQRAQEVWNAQGNVMLVVGATAPEDMRLVRAAAPQVPFLVPGIGEQGGSITDVLSAGLSADGQGLVVSASRSILFAGDAGQVRSAAVAARSQLLAT